MKVITVIPFSKGIHKESLTYFSAKDIPAGTIVSVPVRKKLVDAFVIETKDLLASKSDIKSSTFNLKKVERIKGPSFLSNEFVIAAQRTSKYFASHIGQILNTLIPIHFLKNYKDIEVPNTSQKSTGKKKETEKLVLQKPITDRLLYYKTLIIDSIMAGHSIFICLPTTDDIRLFTSSLEKEIGDNMFVFHSGLSNKKQVESFNKLMKDTRPTLILATASYLFIPKKGIKTIIIEKESSTAYKTITRPYIDFRTFAETLSEELKTKLILGDSLLRIETLWRYKEDDLKEVAPLEFQMPKETEIQIVDMTSRETTQKEVRETTQKDDFEILSNQVKEIIKKTIENGSSAEAGAKEGEQMFLFVLRKGLSPVTVCGDCGTTLLCKDCNVPLVLHEKINKHNKERVFRCNRCKKEQTAKVVCRECGSWNLVPLGIGVDKVVAELKDLLAQLAETRRLDAEKRRKNFPRKSALSPRKSAKTPTVFKIDHETVKTHKQAQEIINEFRNTKGGVLVGTELSLSHLKDKVKNTAIVSFDSLFSIPSFRISEKIIQLSLKLTYLTDKKLLIQTRNPDENILKHIKSGNLEEFYREEIEERKKFNYPPFKTLVKVTFAGGKRDTDKAVGVMRDLFGEYEPEIFKAYIPRIKNRYLTNMVIKIDPTNWPEETLLQKLYSLPPSWTIKVDPEDLL